MQRVNSSTAAPGSDNGSVALTVSAAVTCASRRSCTPWRKSLPGFRYVSALSEVYSSDGWVGLITDLGKAPGRLKGRAATSAPPPMGQAAMPLLTGRAGRRNTSTATSSPPSVSYPSGHAAGRAASAPGRTQFPSSELCAQSAGDTEGAGAGPFVRGGHSPYLRRVVSAPHGGVRGRFCLWHRARRRYPGRR